MELVKKKQYSEIGIFLLQECFGIWGYRGVVSNEMLNSEALQCQFQYTATGQIFCQKCSIN